MVKSADTADLKSADLNTVVGVQVPLRAPKRIDSNALVDTAGCGIGLIRQAIFP
jgi:hypothetical protein